MWAIACAIGAGLCWGIGELFTKSVLHSGQVGTGIGMVMAGVVMLSVK